MVTKKVVLKRENFIFKKMLNIIYFNYKEKKIKNFPDDMIFFSMKKNLKRIENINIYNDLEKNIY